MQKCDQTRSTLCEDHTQQCGSAQEEGKAGAGRACAETPPTVTGSQERGGEASSSAYVRDRWQCDSGKPLLFSECVLLSSERAAVRSPAISEPEAKGKISYTDTV